ncbi:hypothetical protein TSUD_21050 [Trifolium subterraneum]|uniref:Polysaccharide biosynthesis protein C-terminal domain-containing protein n=1 Tax=Trifolium subterraneum TaxID=3900 RepID=A0A2Z6N9B5_TRISU|nr:hypothetical protein TSUD_21050 [Trifolium subterraneum]
MQISVPTIMALAADPIASLIDTAFIGHIGPVELAAVGVSIAIFNQVSKIAIIPLNSPMLKPAQQYLILRSFGAPAVILSMAIQGIFRGIKDTRTPLYATNPLLMFAFRLGVSGAAIAHIISQYLISLILLWSLMKQVVLLPPSFQDFQFRKILKNGFLLLIKVTAVTFCVTLSASLAARQGSTTMAAFQICLQIWMATSLLADGLAVAGQAIIASAFARRDYDMVVASASRVLQLGLILGLLLSFLLFSLLPFASRLFTNDINVLQLIGIGIPYVAATQPINALAFVFDGVNYGVSDFIYSAYSMIMVASVSIFCLYMLSSNLGFTGIWIALSIYMSLRIFAGFWRIGTGSGPWSFLKDQ